MKLFFLIAALIWMVFSAISFLWFGQVTNGLICIAIATGNLILNKLEK